MPDMSLERIASAINTLGAFLGMRDVPELSAGAISDLTGREHADVMVLFGGSILAGGDVLARAMRAGVADKHIIVGGEGHTTPPCASASMRCIPTSTRRICPNRAYSAGILSASTA